VRQERSFSDRLLSWWDKNGRKDLPWQHPRAPYRVWVSEIMLQQTQVSTVIPYFLKWMDRFPTLEVLATSTQDDVLAHWAGLGYYARARNLHKTAIICMESHDASLPLLEDELVSLPGIGLSTANAIISQATDRPAAVLDGNVRRVLARHARVAGWTGSAAVQKILWREAEQRLPTTNGANYTQAIMDLGATLCKRSSPDCAACPVKSDCFAAESNETHLYPAPKPKTRVSERSIFMLVFQDEKKRVLLEKRPPAGIWGGLWSLPQAEDLASLEQQTGLNLEKARLLPKRDHRLTHLKLSIQPVILHSARSEQVKSTQEQCWTSLENTEKPGMPKPIADILDEMKDWELKDRKLKNGEFA
jgi:A/G-specific adenine glycosylase